MTDIQQQAADFTANIDLPRFASGVTAIYGISGSGKSSLVDTAVEYVAERFGLQTMGIAIDPGGWGNRRLSLIRAGVLRVYDPRNHVNYFETMELLSKGAFPAELLDPDRGYAAPDVRLIMPRVTQWIVRCPNGHVAAKYDDAAVMQASSAVCPECGTVTNVSNQKTEVAMVKPAMFRRVGLRFFDSVTAMNDLALQELARMSAAGELPTGRTGGSALGSADAIRQGTFVAGTGSEAQVGFTQNRTYGWLTNIRAIPDQVMGAVCTFGVEESKDDARGGELCYGPAIAGKARTSRVPGWVGVCAHATKEPDASGNMRHRLWLTNHIDPRDSSKRPYMAKHRGTPIDMPDFLEDPWKETPAERAAVAWTVCSLKYFYELQEKQFAQIAARDREKFASFATGASEEEARDEVVSVQAVGGSGPVSAGVATTANPSVTAGGGGMRPGGRRMAGAPAAVAAAPVIAAQPAQPAQPQQPATITEQLEASLAERAAIVAAPATNGNAAVPAAADGAAGAVRADQTALAPNGAPSVPSPIAPTTAIPGPPAGGARRRMARPPTT